MNQKNLFRKSPSGFPTQLRENKVIQPINDLILEGDIQDFVPQQATLAHRLFLMQYESRKLRGSYEPASESIQVQRD